MTVTARRLAPPALPSALVLAAVVLTAAAASAHGPTMSVSYTRIDPPTLSIHVGDTVHFVNANTTGAVTLVGEDGSFESPPLAPHGEGWHHTFTEAGSFPFEIREYGGTTGRVIVVPQPAESPSR